MADDVDYQRDVHQILGEFAQADWETLDEVFPRFAGPAKYNTFEADSRSARI
jgi:hypothetical protein